MENNFHLVGWITSKAEGKVAGRIETELLEPAKIPGNFLTVILSNRMYFDHAE